MTTLSAITTINETLSVLKADSDLAAALREALSALRERHHAELAEKGEKAEQDLVRLSDYPLTIVADRYGGCYSGGAYTAWNLEPWEVPSDIFDGDLGCGSFWAENRLICGKGGTPDEAERDLFNKIREICG